MEEIPRDVMEEGEYWEDYFEQLKEDWKKNFSIMERADKNFKQVKLDEGKDHAQ